MRQVSLPEFKCAVVTGVELWVDVRVPGHDPERLEWVLRAAAERKASSTDETREYYLVRLAAHIGETVSAVPSGYVSDSIAYGYVRYRIGAEDPADVPAVLEAFNRAVLQWAVRFNVARMAPA
jgi:glycine cleavage system aminomethyltransferase T